MASTTGNAQPLEPLIEWCFQFALESALSEVDHRAIADAVDNFAADWATEQELATGGGYIISQDGGRSISAHRFGLCGTRHNQLIPPEVPEELMDDLRSVAEFYGVELSGGWHAFTASEDCTWAYAGV